MIYDLENLDPQARHKLLSATVVPRPIAWIGSVSPEGVGNLAPFAFFNVLSTDPVVFAVGIGIRNGVYTDTGRNLRSTREFTINMVTESHRAAMDVTATVFPPEVDEFEAAGLEKAPSDLIAAPRVKDAPVSFECRLTHEIPLSPTRWVALGQAIRMHIADEKLIAADQHYVATGDLNLLGRAEAGRYVRAGAYL